MANQYKSAFQEAIEEFRPQLEQWGIEIGQNLLVYKGVKIVFAPYTQKRELVRVIRKAIRTAEQAHIKETQAALL